MWRARDLLAPGGIVALKLVHLVGRSPTQVERVRQEARQLQQLHHPSIVQAHRQFEEPELLGVVMSYIDGQSLDAAIRKGGLSPEHRWWVLRHLTAALAYVHERGVVHRDVKPDNVVLTRDFWEHPEDPSQLKLVDFGIAAPLSGKKRLTQEGCTPGTAPYIAPEVVTLSHFASHPGPPQDLFALGVLAWQLFDHPDHPTGLAMSANLFSFAAAYREADRAHWPPATGDAALDDLLRATLPLHPDARAQNAGELLTLVDALIVQRASMVSGDTIVSYGSIGQSGMLPDTDPTHPTTSTGVELPTTADDPTPPGQPPPPASSARPPPQPQASGRRGTWYLEGLPDLTPFALPTINTSEAPPATHSSPAYSPPPAYDAQRSHGSPYTPAARLTSPHGAMQGAPGQRRSSSVGGFIAMLGALVLSVAVIITGAWLLYERASKDPLSSNPATPTLARHPETPPATWLPSGCNGPLCSSKECCMSGFSCNGRCYEYLGPNESFLLRYSGIDPLLDHRGGVVCFVVSGTSRHTCVAVTDGGHPQPRLAVTGGDLARGIDVHVYNANGKLLASHWKYRRDFQRGVMCEGFWVTFTDPAVNVVSFWVDPPDQARQRCEGSQLVVSQE